MPIAYPVLDPVTGVIGLGTWFNTITSGAFWPAMTVVIFAVSYLMSMQWPSKKSVLFASFSAMVSAFLFMLAKWVSPELFIPYVVITGIAIYFNVV